MLGEVIGAARRSRSFGENLHRFRICGFVLLSDSTGSLPVLIFSSCLPVLEEHMYVFYNTRVLSPPFVCPPSLTHPIYRTERALDDPYISQHYMANIHTYLFPRIMSPDLP